jgi:hypothetical protein
MADLKQIGEPAIDNLLDVVAKPEFQDLFPPELKSSMVYIIIILIILSLNDTVLNLPNVDTFAWCYLLCPACDFVHTGNSEVSLGGGFAVYIFDVLTYSTCQIFSCQVDSPKYSVVIPLVNEYAIVSSKMRIMADTALMRIYCSIKLGNVCYGA